MWPVRASSTWSGVRAVRHARVGGPDLIPWHEALARLVARPDGSTLHLLFSHRDARLAAAHRRRAVQAALRAGRPLRWVRPCTPSDTLGLRFAAVLSLALAAFMAFIAFSNFERVLDPTGLSPLIYILGVIFAIGAPILFVAAAVAVSFWSWNRAGTLITAAELTRATLTITRRSGTTHLHAADIQAVRRGFATTLTLKSGTHITLADLPPALVDPWLRAFRPADLARADHADRAAYRRIAIAAPFAGIILAGISAWSEPTRFPSPFAAAFFIAEITLLISALGIAPWLLTKRPKPIPS